MQSSDELIIEPDTPQMQELARNIKLGIQLYGWEKFEEIFVESAQLVLVKEEGGKRFYERKDGQLKLTIGNITPLENAA